MVNRTVDRRSDKYDNMLARHIAERIIDLYLNEEEFERWLDLMKKNRASKDLSGGLKRRKNLPLKRLLYICTRSMKVENYTNRIGEVKEERKLK